MKLRMMSAVDEPTGKKIRWYHVVNEQGQVLYAGTLKACRDWMNRR